MDESSSPRSAELYSSEQSTHHIDVAARVSFRVDEGSVRVRVVLLLALRTDGQAHGSEDVVQSVDLLLDVILALHEGAGILPRFAGVRLRVWERELDVLVRFGNGHDAGGGMV